MRYSGAPYNFVPITEEIYQRYEEEKKLPKHNEINSEYLSGELICSIRAITDIFVGSGKIKIENGEKKQEFYKGIDGNYAIPGSSLRGLVRNNMQVLGFGSIAGDVENYNIMYRTVAAAKSKLSKSYSKIVPKNVKAGYIKKVNEEYRIYKTEDEHINKRTFGEYNYYPVYEPFVMKENEDAEEQEETLPFSAFAGDGAEKLQHIGKSTDFESYNKNGKKHVKGRENEQYVPYYMPVYYKLNHNRKVVSIVPYHGECPSDYKDGYVISTGKMSEKKRFYVVPKYEESGYITIPEKDIASFRHDYESKKNKLHGALEDKKLIEECRTFFALPKEGEIKPVFYYIEYDKSKIKRVYFGYTPFLRIFYEHSVLDGISEAQRKYMDANGDLTEAVLDYPSAILGYATDKSSYKSRVYFEDMKLQEGETEYPKEKKVTLNQGEPKLSSYWDYLVQDRDDVAMTYNDNDFQLRGIKQYWLRPETISGGEINNDNFAETICPLKENAVFKGKIHFKNLTKDELGLLLWSLSLEVDSNQNIGRGKAFGYGRIDISIEQLRLYDYHKMYESDGLKLNVFDEETEKQTAQSVNDFINSYKEFINPDFSKETNLMKSSSIDTFLKMKNIKMLPDKEKIKYMELKEYQNRDIPLQTSQEVLERTKYRHIREQNNNNGNENTNNNSSNRNNNDKNKKKRKN